MRSQDPDDRPNRGDGPTSRLRPAGRTALAALPYVIVVLACMFAVGSPLLGRTDAFPGDLVLRYAPWSEEIGGTREGTAPTSDIVDVVLPRHSESRDRLLDGDLPEWDPLVAGGGQLMAGPAAGAYNPAVVASYPFPARFAPGLIKLLGLLAAAGGMYLFLRRVGLDAVAASTGGALYTFSGFQTVWGTWSQPLAGACIPWVFWSVERLLARRRLVDALPVALSVAAMLSAGFPAVLAYTLYALGGYLVLRQIVVLLRDDRFRPMTWAREQVRAALTTGLGVALGIGLVAIIILPFYDRVAADRLDDRAGYAAGVMAPKLIATLGFPHAFGVLNQTLWFAPLNEVEAVAYVGAAALVLALFAVLTVRRAPALLTFVVPAATLSVVLVLAMYRGGLVHDLVAGLPGVASSPIGRLRCVLGFFLSGLAAVGAHHVATRREGFLARLVTVGAVVAVGVISVRMIRQFASNNGQLDDIWRPWMLASIGSAAVACAAVLLGRRWLPARVLSLGLLLLVVVEGMFFVRPYLPRVDREVSIPTTEAHRYLREEQDEMGRVAAHRQTLYPGTTRLYGLRSLTGHTFHPDEVESYLLELDPTTFDRSPTISAIDLADPDVMRSPLLDRAAVDLGVVPLTEVPFGQVLAPVAVAASDTGAEGRIDVGALRGVLVSVAGPTSPTTSQARLHVEVVEDGEVVAVAERKVDTPVTTDPIPLALAGEDLDQRDRLLRITLRGADGTRFPVDVRDVSPIVAVDDGLELVHVSGVAVWRRADALARFRWASDAVAAPDESSRLDLLASGTLDPDTVVLEASPAESGGPGRIDALDLADPDRFSVDVSSASGGWLVVADAMQRGWYAQVDGESVDLLPADHAFAAVRVPAGDHRVTFDYRPPHSSTGRVVSAASILVVGAVAVMARRRRTGSTDGSEESAAGVVGDG